MFLNTELREAVRKEGRGENVGRNLICACFDMVVKLFKGLFLLFLMMCMLVCLCVGVSTRVAVSPEARGFRPPRSRRHRQF